VLSFYCQPKLLSSPRLLLDACFIISFGEDGYGLLLITACPIQISPTAMRMMMTATGWVRWRASFFPVLVVEELGSFIFLCWMFRLFGRQRTHIFMQSHGYCSFNTSYLLLFQLI
jgi:hypothetical protein